MRVKYVKLKLDLRTEAQMLQLFFVSFKSYSISLVYVKCQTNPVLYMQSAGNFEIDRKS